MNEEVAEAILEVVESQKPQNVQELVKLLQHLLPCSREEIIKQVLELQSEGKITLQERHKRTKSDLATFLRTEPTSWFWTTIILASMSAVAVYAVPENDFPLAYVRYLLGAAFVLYLPGYTLTRVLFPKSPATGNYEGRLDSSERLALSIGLSLTVAPLIGLMLRYTPLGLQLTPLILTLFGATLIFSTIGLMREYQFTISPPKLRPFESTEVEPTIMEPESTVPEQEQEAIADSYVLDELVKVTEDSARGGFFLFSGSLLSTVIMAISAILIGRFLGPELYGQYNLVLVIPQLLLLFTDLGINAGITKFAASLRSEGKNEKVPRIIRHAVIFRLIVGVIVFIISIIFASYFAILINRPDFTFFIQIASISVIFQVIYSVSTSAFVGLDRSEYNALATNVQAIVKTILQIVFVLLGFSIAGALLGYVGGFVIASIFAAAILFFRLLKIKTADRKDSFKDTLRLLNRYGWPIYVSVLLLGFIPLYQQVVLAFFTSDAAIGNYRAATNFILLLSVIPTSITTALLPAFSKLDTSPTEKVKIFFKRANKYTCLLIVPTTTMIVLFSTQIVELVYGPIYNSAPFFLTISCLSYFLVAIGYLGLTSLFNGIGETRLTLRVTIVNFILLIILSPIFAGLYQVPGVLIAALVATAIGAFYAAYIGRSILKVEFHMGPITRIYAGAGLSSIPSLILLYLTPFHGVIVLLAGTIAYLAVFVTLMPLIRIVTPGEIKALRYVTGKIPLLNLIARPILGYQEWIVETW